MNDQAPTVSDLVARFQLRRRASTEAFRAGVRLARCGDVTVGDIAPNGVSAEVRDPHPMRVELHVESGALVGNCPCSVAAHGVCRHQVAVAHSIWVSLRRYPGAR